MRKKLVRHGNSRAIVLDKAILELLDIDDDTDLDLSTDGRALIIVPQGDAEAYRARIDEALTRVDERHGETLKKLAE